MKARFTTDGVHFFERRTGLNMLLEEICVPDIDLSRAPANVSIALTNACNLMCSHCFAPKIQASLNAQDVKRWILELSEAGCLGVGFGGGEPILYKNVEDLFRFVRNETDMACTLTSNGTLLTDKVICSIADSIDFLRISTNGRCLSYDLLRHTVAHVRVGVNYLLNAETVKILGRECDRYATVGVQELLLLPQIRTCAVGGVSADVMQEAESVIRNGDWPIRLAISAVMPDGFHLAVGQPGDHGLRQYAHISASGEIKRDSTERGGVKIGNRSVLAALEELEALG